MASHLTRSSEATEAPGGLSAANVGSGASPQRRLRILHCATEAFLDRGFAGANLEDIAAAAGVGKAAIYLLFGTKAELFAQCLLEAASASSTSVRTVLRTDRPVEDVLVDLATLHIERMFRPVFGSRPYYEFARILLSTSITHPELSRRCLDVLKQEEGLPLQEYFAEAIRKGLLVDADPAFLMDHFIQTIFFTNYVILEPKYRDEYRDVKDYAKRTVHLFLYGCAPTRP